MLFRSHVVTQAAEDVDRFTERFQIEIRPDSRKLNDSIRCRIRAGRFEVKPEEGLLHARIRRSRDGRSILARWSNTGGKMSDNASARLPFLILGPVLGAVAFGALQMTGWDTKACWTGAIAATTVVWWITEPIPIPAASLLPLGAFPVTGVLSAGQVASAYGSQLVLLLLGGFILSTAMEASGAHRRVALSMVNLVGGHSSRRIVFGFMAASALLSMWISNTATTLMLLPVALAVIERSKDPELPIPLLLGVAYAASVGGIGTPIGTPPNVVFMQVYRDTTGTDVDFVTWMTWAIPVVVVFVPIVWLWMTRRLTYEGQVEMPDVGKWDPYEKRVLIVFALTALAWVTRRQPFGEIGRAHV